MREHLGSSRHRGCGVGGGILTGGSGSQLALL